MLVGPPLGGTLFAIRPLLPFLADSISYLVSVASLSIIRVPFQATKSVTRQRLAVEIGEGLRFVWRQPVVRALAFLNAGNNFFGAGYTLIVIVAAQHQHTGDAIIGLIFGIGGVGGILGALLVEPVRRRVGLRGIILSGLWIFALLWLLPAAVPTPIVLGLITGAIFLTSPIYNVAVISYRLALTPDALQGRVNSVARLIANGLAPAGLAVTGVLLEHIGPQLTVLLATLGLAAIAVAGTAAPSIRHVPAIAADQVGGS